jgi:hypothetical protein
VTLGRVGDVTWEHHITTADTTLQTKYTEADRHNKLK